MAAEYRLAWPPVTRNFKILAAVLTALWLGTVLWGDLRSFVSSHLLLSPTVLTEQLGVWSLVTYSLWHVNFGQLFFTLVGLYLFGAEVDARWSAGRFWGMLGAATLAGGALALLPQFLFDVPAARGFGGPVMACVAAYCWNYWNRSLHFFFFELTGKALLGGFVVLDVLLAIFSGNPNALALHLGGLIVGLVFAARPSGLRAMIERARHERRKSRFEIVPRQPEDAPRRRTDDGQWIN